MSYRKILKSKGPKIDPFGTPLNTFPYSLKELFILLRWSLFVRWLFIKSTELLSKPYALSFGSSDSWFRLSKALDKFIIITPTFDTLFSLTFQDSIILKREFCMLWFFQNSVRYFEMFCMYLFSCVKRMLSKSLVKFDRVLIDLQLSLEMLSSILKTRLISAIFIKFGKLFSFRQSLKILASFSQ